MLFNALLYMIFWNVNADKLVGPLLFTKIKNIGMFSHDWIIISTIDHRQQIDEQRMKLTDMIIKEKDRLSKLNASDWPGGDTNRDVKSRLDEMIKLENIMKDKTKTFAEIAAILRRKRNIFGSIISELTDLATKGDVNIVH